ncbi:MAG: cytochrome P450 [Salinisphaeraceae bacterium]|nr:cytochrome P450 [Salinisphaeraceae bacterium]
MATTANTLNTAQDPWSMPLEDIDVSQPHLYRDDILWDYFARLRRDAPVHYCPDSQFGAYWSVSKFHDIMEVEKHHEIYSSESRDGGITIMEDNSIASLPMFIAMDEPRHGEQRKTVSPIVGADNLAQLRDLILQRTVDTLDSLPASEDFDWVERVSIPLTTAMLATLFDFPWEDRHLLTHWSDVATTIPGAGVIDSEEERLQIMQECAEYMTRLWNERLNAEPGNDVLSMLAHSDRTRDMSPEEFLGNMFLIIVGGNDTTRSSMTGGLYAMSKHPGEYDRLSANPTLLKSAIPEIIRWQTPLSHMRRKALRDTELGGQQIKAGDKVIMWYVSGNRDDEVIDNPDAFIVDRKNARHHLSFGFGIHRCVGNRLAEMQLHILWEEMLKRWPKAGQIEVTGEPRRVLSNFIKGYETLPVRINA